MNKSKSIFLVDDPWHSHFIPEKGVLAKLDDKTVKNFTEFVPIIHKFEIE
jgi:hypothetical protein